MSYTKLEKPINTKVQMIVGFREFSDIFILGETEKAFLISYNKPYKRGAGVSSYNEATQWIPKKIWYDTKYFEKHSNDDIIFNRPIWLK